MAAAAARRRCRRTAAVVQAAARGWGTLRPPDCRLLASAQALGACAHHPASTLDLCVAPTASGTPTPFCARRACVLRPSLSAPMVSASSSCCLALLHPLRSPLSPSFLSLPAGRRSVCPSFATPHSARPVYRPHSFWNADLLCTPSVRSASAAVCASSLRVVLSVSRNGTPASSCLAPSSLPSAPLRLLAALDLSVAHTASGTPTPSVHAKRVFCVRCCPRQLSEHRAASLGRCQLSGQSVPLGRS
ncbi:hypothetical protein AB1Y20_019962 [Prymnesium parvum]|uniref:Uncharacterized protein n=1 Tax=Prymnesium parvum TaxID=97485 RepID=A0AB34JTC2_PRYPA